MTAPVTKRTQGIVVISSTLAFTLCFACWVQNAVLVTHLVRQGVFPFDEGQIGWLLATPILTGAITRVPLGILTDRYGGRVMFAAVMVLSAIPMLALSFAESFWGFLLASVAFGLTGGSFAVGVGYVSLFFEKKRQGLALGIFGVGNAGAALTTLLLPGLLSWATGGGATPDGWRMVPRLEAGLLLVAAVAFYAVTQTRRPPAGPSTSLSARLAPLRDAVVWRFGLYYFLVFGAFVTLAQWLIPYSVNVYDLTVGQAGQIASVFSLPAAAVSLVGGVLADKFGARPMMTWVFRLSILVCLLLSLPKLDVTSPGEGVLAKAPGTVTAVSPEAVVVDAKSYPLKAAPAAAPEGTVSTGISTRQQAVVAVGDKVTKNQLLARGSTRIQYSAHLYGFAGLIGLLGIVLGIGKACVLKFIPEQFPASVGAVGGAVGLLGALSGFFFPILFGYLLRSVGIWTTCFVVLLLLSAICLFSLQYVAGRIVNQEAPDLARLIERRPSTAVPSAPLAAGRVATLDELLKGVSFLADLSAEQRKSVAALGRQLKVAAGGEIFAQGSPGDALYVVLSGEVEIVEGDLSKAPRRLGSFKAGKFFGEMALLDGGPRSATARATEDCDLFLLSRTDFLSLLSKSPQMVADVLIGLSTIIRERSALGTAAAAAS